MDTTTLITKVLLPRRREDVLTRQRLLDQLYDMVDYKLVLLSAPAGYGKSTLLVDFAADLEHPVCWYALDASDHDPYLFLQRLVMSLRRRFPDFGEATLRALDAGGDLTTGAPGVVRILVNEIVKEIPRWFVLVLDDYHALGASPEIDAIVSNFVASQRDQCLTIIASRTVPNLPLIIPLVARGGVGGIGHEVMRFTAEEIQELFAHNYDVVLSPSEARAMAEQSEGWITGLLLVAYTRLQGVLQSWMRARDAVHQQPVYDYLAQEVFDGQSDAMQAFLLSTSTLSEMNGALCREVLDIREAETFLEAIETRNLFVTRLEGNWFRYHHLFREFLQTQLHRCDPDHWADLHRRAARWYMAHDQVHEAVEHWLIVQDYTDAGALMADIARDLYVGGSLTTLVTWYERLPADVLEIHPRLALFVSRAAYKLGRREVALDLTDIAARGYHASGDMEGLAYARLQRSEVRLSQGALQEALALSEATLAWIEKIGVPVIYEAHRMLGRTYVRLGDLAQAHLHLSKALAASETQGQVYDQALIRTGLAQCLGREGQLAEAVMLNREAVSMWRELGSDAPLVDELNDLGFHLYIHGSYDEAMPNFQEALAISQATGLREAEAVALANLGEMARDLGLLAYATDLLQQSHDLAMEIGDQFVATYTLEALGLVYRADGALPHARETIVTAIEAAQQQGSHYQLGRYRASLGVVLAELGDPVAGLRELDTSLNIYAESGPSLDSYRARLLKAWVSYLADDRQGAVALLGQLLDDVPPAVESHVFVVEGRHVAPLYRLAHTAFKQEAGRTQRLNKIARRVKALADAGERLFPQSISRKVTEAPELRVYGFGPGRVTLGGEEIPATAWGAVTARHLLFYMLIYGSRSREQIFADFWPHLTPQKAKANFHTTKFRLHRAVGHDVIDFDGRAYHITPEVAVWFDVKAFRKGFEAWRFAQDVEALAEAVALYDEDFLTDCYMDWCIVERESLRLRFLESLEILADRWVIRRQYRRAIQVLRRALAQEPAHEACHRQLMRAYALSGQRSRALAQYKRCQLALDQELDAAPSRQTEELYARILNDVSIE